MQVVTCLVLVFCFLVGTPGSAVILSYFVSKAKDKTASTFLNICISSTDLIICLLILSPLISGNDWTKLEKLFNDTRMKKYVF